MHLLHDKPVNALIAVAGFIFLGLFLMFSLLDFDTRDNLQPRNLPTIIAPPPAGAPGAAAPAGTAPAATTPPAAAPVSH